MYLLIALFSILVSTTLVFLLTRIAFKKRQSTFVEKPLTIFEMAATAGSQRFKQTMFMEHVSKGILKPVLVLSPPPKNVVPSNIFGCMFKQKHLFLQNVWRRVF